jgi:hypothetical protein
LAGGFVAGFGRRPPVLGRRPRFSLPPLSAAIAILTRRRGPREITDTTTTSGRAGRAVLRCRGCSPRRVSTRSGGQPTPAATATVTCHRCCPLRRRGNQTANRCYHQYGPAGRRPTRRRVQVLDQLGLVTSNPHPGSAGHRFVEHPVATQRPGLLEKHLLRFGIAGEKRLRPGVAVPPW